MKLGIMQPYFFPYLGYFDLLYNVDLFIVYDTVQFIKQGWINRNRILHSNKSGWQYISIPVDRASFHSSYRTPIRDIKASNVKPWKQHILGQLAHYEKAAPFANETIGFVKDCFVAEDDTISKLNIRILEQCTKLLKLNFQYNFCSELGIELDTTRNAEERILDLCEYLGATEYVNLPGGIDLYHSEAFERRNIKLTFRSLPTFVYTSEPYVFEPNLSIIDLLMWNEPEVIKKYLDGYRN
jgi:hypothetical protein